MSVSRYSVVQFKLCDCRQTKIEEGEGISDANLLDVASVVKQFFRDLPDPLLTTTLHDAFLRCALLGDDAQSAAAVLYLCHLLPPLNLSTLRYTMCFLGRVVAASDRNKMDASNLAVCLTPNLLYLPDGVKSNGGAGEKSAGSDGRLLAAEISVVQVLIRHAHNIGMVSESLQERAALLSSCFPPASGDELDRSEVDGGGGSTKTKKKKKKRSGSLQGI